MNNNFYINNLNRNKTLLIPSFCYHERLSINIKFKDIFLIKLFQRKFHISTINRCGWKSLLNKLSNKDMKFMTINKNVNKHFFEKNKKLYEDFLNKGLITKFQYDALSSNNTKFWSAGNHPAVCFEEDNCLYCITQTSHNVIEGINGIINIKQIKEGNRSVFQNIERYKVKEIDGKLYVFVIWKWQNKEFIKAYYEVEGLNKMTRAEIESFQKNLNNELINQFKIIETTIYTETPRLLEEIVSSNIEKKIIKINEKKSNINLSIFNKEEN